MKKIILLICLLSSFSLFGYNYYKFDNRRSNIINNLVKVKGTNSFASGVIINQNASSCYILTAYHIIDTSIMVEINNEEYVATLLDFNEEMDYAILEVTFIGIKAETTNSIHLLDKVISIGYPQGIRWISEGIISNINTDIGHSCGIFFGSSGGPVYNSNYKVIGINKSFHVIERGFHYPTGFMSYAIPISKISKDLGKEKSIQYFGVYYE